MAGDDQNKDDEYQFTDLDVFGAEQDAVSLPEDEAYETEPAGVASPPNRGRLDGLNPDILKMIQKGAIAVIALVFVVFMYKIGTAIFHTKSASQQVKPKLASKPVPQQQVVRPAPAKPPVALTENVMTSLKVKQEQTERELLAIRSQLGTMSQNMSDLSAQLADVKQTMLVLHERLEKQSEQMVQLKSVRRQHARQPKSVRRVDVATRPVYYIQAIIPGRAWLISTQGSTLTVSQGSMIPGYGTVRLINAKIGRVFTSSGRVIRFSQADS